MASEDEAIKSPSSFRGADGRWENDSLRILPRRAERMAMVAEGLPMLDVSLFALQAGEHTFLIIRNEEASNPYLRVLRTDVPLPMVAAEDDARLEHRLGDLLPLPHAKERGTPHLGRGQAVQGMPTP